MSVKKIENVTKETDLSLYHPCKNHGCKPVIFRVYWGRSSDLVARCPQDETGKETIFDGRFTKWNKHNPLPTFAERLRHHAKELKRMGIT